MEKMRVVEGRSPTIRPGPSNHGWKGKLRKGDTVNVIGETRTLNFRFAHFIYKERLSYAAIERFLPPKRYLEKIEGEATLISLLGCYGDSDCVDILGPYSHVTGELSNGDSFSYPVTVETEPPPEQPLKPLYRVLHDVELIKKGIIDPDDAGIKARMEKHYPEVMLFTDINNMPIVKKRYMGRSIQEMCFALLQYGAPSQSLERAKKKYRVIYDWVRAFTNGSGFDNPDGTILVDYINNFDGGNLPAFDKARVCGGATISGEVVGDKLKVEALTGAVDIEYLKENRHLFFTAMNSGANPSDWAQGDGEPVYIPLIAPKSTELYYPLNRLERVDEIADPYEV